MQTSEVTLVLQLVLTVTLLYAATVCLIPVFRIRNVKKLVLAWLVLMGLEECNA